MESRFGMENMARDAAVTRMVQAHEKDMREAARTARMLAQAAPARPAWYCPVLVCIGKVLIAFGSYLNTHYSVQPTLRAQ